MTSEGLVAFARLAIHQQGPSSKVSHRPRGAQRCRNSCAIGDVIVGPVAGQVCADKRSLGSRKNLWRLSLGGVSASGQPCRSVPLRKGRRGGFRRLACYSQQVHRAWGRNRSRLNPWRAARSCSLPFDDRIWACPLSASSECIALWFSSAGKHSYKAGCQRWSWWGSTNVTNCKSAARMDWQQRVWTAHSKVPSGAPRSRTAKASLPHWGPHSFWMRTLARLLELS